MIEGGSTKICEQIRVAFEDAGISGLPDGVFPRLTSYLELLVRWNARLNLTSVRDVSDIVRIHLVECAFAAFQVPEDVETLLDYGSGAGFPGILIAACCPRVHVTLAEANIKKAAFLREVARTIGVRAEIFSGRVESMASNQSFDAVSLRAVEKMDEAITVALDHAKKYLFLLTTSPFVPAFSRLGVGFEWLKPIPLPNSVQRVVLIGRRSHIA